MSVSLKFHTPGCMIAASRHTYSYAAPYHPVEHALDFDPNTYWETAADSAYVSVDLGSPQPVQSAAFVLHNYDSITGTPSVMWRYSTDGYSFYLLMSELYTPADRIITLTYDTPINARYYRFDFGGHTSVLDISMLLCCKYGALTLGNQYPEDDAESFRNFSQEDMVGNLLVYSGHRLPYRQFTRTFLFPSATDWNTLNAAFIDCRGSRLPFILDEDDSLSVVRFTQDELAKNEIDYRMYNPTVGFRELVLI